MSSLHPQRGMALIVSLLLLLILTVLAISMATTSTLQQRISANAQQQNVAFQAAESGLQSWVTWFEAHSAPPSGNDARVPLQPATGSEGTSARAALSQTQFSCANMIPPQSLNAGGGSLSYTCYMVSSLAKACKDLSDCDVNTADGQARALHQRSYIQATHL